MIDTWVKHVSNVGVQQGMSLSAIQKRVVFNWSNVLTILIAVYGLLYLSFSKVTVSRLGILLVSISILLIATVVWVLLHNGQFGHSINISFVLFPPLFVALSIATQNILVEVYLLILCLVAFFLIKKKRHINLAFLYIMFCFIAGQLIITDDQYPNNLPWLFLNIAAFLALYITLDAVRSYTPANLVRDSLYINKANSPVEGRDRKLRVKAFEQEVAELQQKVNSLSELNQIKTVLFSVVAHDLKDNIYSLNRNLDIAKNTDDSSAFLNEILPLLKEETENSVVLLQRLLKWSKTLFHNNQASPVLVDINSAINDVIKLYTHIAREKNVHFVTKIDHNLTAFADPNMLDVVLRNVVANAVKYNAPGFPVSIYAEKEGEHIQLSVIDYGIGIEESELEMLTGKQTDPTDKSGTRIGLGLLLCRELLQRNNATIHITSTKGMGTKVVIAIPVMKKTKE